MEQNEKLLKDHSTEEKTAYLKAIAAIATADRSASAEELEFLNALSASAELPAEAQQSIRQTATQSSTDGELSASMQVLKNSELRFSLLADIMAFAEADSHFSEGEKQYIENLSQELNINQQQFSTINQFVNKASAAQLQPEAVAEPQGFLESLGMKDQFSNAGMNFGNISKGFLGMLAPLLLSKLFSGRGNSGGGLGGMLGGMLGGNGGGGLGGMLGGNNTGGGTGGLGSLISMINGGKGGNISDMLGRMFGKR